MTLFNEATNCGLLVGAAHIALPSLGHGIVQDGQFVWLPSSYTTQLQPPHNLEGMLNTAPAAW